MLRKWRSESVLDLYNLLLAAILFGAPAFLAHASRTADLDLGLTGLAIIILSLAAMIAFSIWEEWINVALGLWLVAGMLAGWGVVYLFGWLAIALQVFFILCRWDESDALSCRRSFVANQWVGLTIWLTIMACHLVAA